MLFRSDDEAYYYFNASSGNNTKNVTIDFGTAYNSTPAMEVANDGEAIIRISTQNYICMLALYTNNYNTSGASSGIRYQFIRFDPRELMTR